MFDSCRDNIVGVFFYAVVGLVGLWEGRKLCGDLGEDKKRALSLCEKISSFRFPSVIVTLYNIWT